MIKSFKRMALVLLFATFFMSSCLDVLPEDEGKNCPDGSRCCKTENGVQIVAITVPIDCECPKNTTYILTDKKFNVKQCDCNDCD